jgi:hypothetical protein
LIARSTGGSFCGIIMNITKRRDRPQKPAAATNRRLNLMEESLVASQVSDIATEKKKRKRASTSKQSPRLANPPQLLTTIEAKIDVGFGNAVFIRGHGAELSWDKGLPLNCANASTWIWSTKGAKDKLVFKLLLNDQIWAKGEDVVVEAGKMIELAPAF